MRHIVIITWVRSLALPSGQSDESPYGGICMDELIRLVEEVYRQGSKDHSDQTKDCMDEYFHMMAAKIMRMIS